MMELRTALEARYPNRVLVSTEATIQHMVKSSSRSPRGFKYAVGELWAFSLTDIHIITKMSGFGKVREWTSGPFSWVSGEGGGRMLGVLLGFSLTVITRITTLARCGRGRAAP